MFHFESYGGGPADLSGSVPQEPKGMSAVGRVSTDGFGLPAQPYSNLDSSRLKRQISSRMSCGSLIRSQKSFTITCPSALQPVPISKREDPHENLQLAMLAQLMDFLLSSVQPPHKDAFSGFSIQGRMSPQIGR